MQEVIDNQAQHHVRNEIEIMGIPETPNENLVHVAILTATKVGVDLSELEIDEIKRVGPRRSSDSKEKRPRPIVARLLRKAKRTELVKAAASRKGLTTEDIVPGTSDSVFINERLTKKNRLLFRESRNRAELYKYRFCWTRDGGIFLRRAEKKAAILIRSYKDLDEKIGPAVDCVVEPDLPLPRTPETEPKIQ